MNAPFVSTSAIFSCYCECLPASFKTVLFLLTLIFFAVHKLYSRFLGNSHGSPDINKPLIGPNRALPRTTFGSSSL
ncbi:hypothetical protein V6N13_004724 [Hibiscus sabdariffa]|uniref:Uncharacterized protein n=1 Tax=Hibiscus sabdariffa TaxID=183260 RepID=A0ABR2RZZ1_9ROSI